MHPYWHKQASDKPLFPDLLWSRPENRLAAGKLLIVGGNLHGFASPAEAYTQAIRAGIGTARVLLPNAIRPYFPHFRDLVLEMGAATPSGSFSQRALDEFLSLGTWSDGVLLAGDLGRNSETAILLEKFADKYTGQLTITKDAADYFTSAPHKILARPDTTLVISLAQLQKLSANAKFPRAFTFSMSLLQLVETLHDFTTSHRINVVVKHLENSLVASSGRVSSTKLVGTSDIWRVSTAAHVGVWWLQNPRQPFEALTTAIFEKFS